MANYRYGSLINGTWQAEGAAIFTTVNPASPAETVGHYHATAPEQIDTAIQAAQSAQREWRALPAAERIRICNRFFAAIAARQKEIAFSITLEQGKPLLEARNEAAKSLGEAEAMAAHLVASGAAAVSDARPGFQNLVARRPRGIIAAITPWNFPILTPMRKIAPALLFGNAIIIKPSEFTPATTCLIGEAACETLPAGLLQIVLGGSETGARLVSARGVDGITFTGSVATGKKIYALGAENLAELSLELGGKNAVVINDVKDLDACLDQVAGAAFMCAGQRCTAISRVIVAENLREAVAAGLVKRAAAQKQGNGAHDGVTLGPLTSRAQFDRVVNMVERGVAEGAQVLFGGLPSVKDPDQDGYFFQATILGNVTSQMAIARKEVFGPVIGISSYRTIDEAFAILNGVEYGLSSSLFSSDFTVVQRFIAESESGMLHVNHGTIPDNHMPFGGIKHSGVGAYSVGPSAANFYTTEHSIYLKAQ